MQALNALITMTQNRLRQARANNDLASVEVLSRTLTSLYSQRSK